MLAIDLDILCWILSVLSTHLVKLEPQTLAKSLYPKEALSIGAVWSLLVPGREAYEESQLPNSSSANIKSRPVSDHCTIDTVVLICES